MVTVSALFLRWTPHYGLSMLTLPAITLICAIAIVLTHRLRTDRGVRGIGDDEPSLGGRPGAPLGLVAVILVLGIVGTIFVLQAP